MNAQTLIFTALPNGIAADKLRLSVYIAPRLWTQDSAVRTLSLEQFPDFWDFPAQVEGMTFTVQFENGATFSNLKRANTDALRADMWQVLFKQPPYVEDFPAVAPYQFEAESVANTPIERLPISALGAVLRQAFQQGGRAVDHDAEGAFGKLQAALAAESTPAKADLATLLDFHRVLALLGNFPELLHALGLVVDLEVPLTAEIPRAVAAQEGVSVQVLAHWTPKLANTHLYSPRTHYILSETRFMAAPRPESYLREGLFRLDDSARFAVQQVDVVGAALHALHSSTLPPLRTVGLAVLQRDLPEQLQARARHAEALNSALQAESTPTAALYAEDVLRGFRLDVWDSVSNRWHSTHQRRSAFDFIGTSGAKIRVTDEQISEGFAQVSLREAADGKGLVADEMLLVWDGWSLSAPRPSKATDTESDATPGDWLTPFGIEAHFSAAPRTLPRLRFGRSYRLRLRAVDLAGNSVFMPNTADFQQAQAECSAPITFQRHEPIAPPIMLPRSVPAYGESLETLVVRSGAGSDHDTARSERHFAPPPLDPIYAEWYGAFDGKTSEEVQALHGRTLKVVGEKPPEAALLMSEVDFMPFYQPDALGRNVALYGLRQEEGFWLMPELDFTPFYLPDALGRGVVFYGLPGVPEGEPFRVPFEGSYPDLLPFRLRLVAISAHETPQPPQYGVRIPNASALLTVQLRPSEVRQVRYATYADEADLQAHGLHAWLNETADPTPLLTPFRSLTLIHAAAQPLAAPQITALSATRTYGDTAVRLSGTATLHAASTGKLDLLATWTEPHDDPAQPFDAAKQRSALFGALPISTDQDSFSFADVLQHFGDTKHREVTYTPIAATKFNAYFDPALFAEDATLETVRPTAEERKDGVGEKRIAILNSARPLPPQIAYIVPSFGWQAAKHVPNADGSAQVALMRQGGSLRIYLKRPWFSSGAGEMLGVVFRRAPFAETPAAMRAYLTQWGGDPLWESSAPVAMPSAENFLNAAPHFGVTLAEVADQSNLIGVAPYPVSYDATRSLWYADVTLNVGAAYFPFVRLALARYQPNSIADAHLSPIVLSDFAQLPPDRTLQLTFNADKQHIALALEGISYRPNAETPRRRIEARIERKRTDMTGDLAWEPAAFVAAETEHTESVWRGTLTLSEPYRADTFRLALTESEPLPYDATNGEGLIDVGRAISAYLWAF
jgi:hypothetical protein